VRAETHTEVYRPYTGSSAPSRFQFLALARSCIRTAARRKLPLVLLLAPPAIATIIYAFVVYMGFAIEQGAPPQALGEGGNVLTFLASKMVNNTARQLIQVRDTIVNFHLATNVFSLLLMAWYGAGQIAEDRRLGAHLLYFARPLTRLDYVLAKLLTVAFFGSLSAVVPGLVICVVATFASPEWSFLKQQWDVILATIGFGLFSTLVMSCVVLAVSSLASRRTFALIGVFAHVMLSGALGGILAALQRERDFRAIGILQSCARVAAWMFDIPRGFPRFSLTLALVSVGVTLVLSLWIVWSRVKRLEVVA